MSGADRPLQQIGEYNRPKQDQCSITADYDTTPDVDELANGIEDGVKRLAAISRARRRTRGRPIPAASAS